MNKGELIDVVAERFDHSKKDVANLVDAVLDELKAAVARGEKVALSGFGVFESRVRAARQGRNPQTGATVKIKATTLPKFRPGAEFKALVSGAKKAVTKKAAPAKKAAAKKTVKKAAPAKKAAAKKTVKKAAPAKKAAAKKTVKKAAKR